MLISLNHFAEAKPFARKQLQVAKQALGESHIETIWTAVRLAEALRRNPAAVHADLIRAEELYADCAKKMRVVLGPLHPDTRHVEEKLVFARQALARFPR